MCPHLKFVLSALLMVALSLKFLTDGFFLSQIEINDKAQPYTTDYYAETKVTTNHRVILLSIDSLS